jgi:formylglycine-generating enzyme required for sulfatase activity
MLRLTHCLVVMAFALIPALPLQGGAGGKDKEDPLIAAMKFVKVPKGTFWMGGAYSPFPDNRFEKQVEIEQDFELAAYTVTQEQWQAVMGNNPSWFSREGGGKDKVKDSADADLKRFPVEQVSWIDVQEFLKKLNAREKGKGWVYRLPSGAQWEYACRGAATSKEDCLFDFYLDKPTNNLSSTQANFNGDLPAGKAAKGPNLGRPTKVGSYAPNQLGLYDMHGNVGQWCADLCPGDSRRLARGGSWYDDAEHCRAASGFGGEPSYRYIILGLRLARTR